MPILDGLMREVLADVDVLGPLVAADDVAPPFDAGRVVLVVLGRCTGGEQRVVFEYDMVRLWDTTNTR